MRRPLIFRKKSYGALEPDEIFIDSQNLPEFDTAHLEGRIERPLGARSYLGLLVTAGLILLIFVGQTMYLTIVEQEYFAQWSADNHLRHEPLLADRGLVLDRTGLSLAENASSATSTATSTPVSERHYPLGEAAAQVVGYISYPKRDQNGVLYQRDTVGIIGAELFFNDELQGINGTRIVEADARGTHVSGSVVEEPQRGRDVVLTIDLDLQKAVYALVKDRVDASFVGGAAAIMDVHTGELLALVSYPSFDPGIMSAGEPRDIVQKYISDTRSPFVDRAAVGLYTPGSIVKPFLAAAMLDERVVTPETTFISTGRLVVPNPYDPEKPSIFKDWKAHGVVDMRRAIAVSSDVYFYIVGGGFEKQRGLGVSAINTYARAFGFGERTGFIDEEEPDGVVPNPEWKARTFNETVWRVGDTYNTSIGQYGWQVTLLQSVRATAALVNGGTLVTPIIRVGAESARESVAVTESSMRVAREGMRMAVTDGTARQLSFPQVKVAAKTGTAETGVRKEFINSLVIGFFPYDQPRYAFAVILERSRAGTLVGAQSVMHNIFKWITINRPEMYTPLDNTR